MAVPLIMQVNLIENIRAIAKPVFYGGALLSRHTCEVIVLTDTEEACIEEKISHKKD